MGEKKKFTYRQGGSVPAEPEKEARQAPVPEPVRPAQVVQQPRGTDSEIPATRPPSPEAVAAVSAPRPQADRAAPKKAAKSGGRKSGPKKTKKKGWIIAVACVAVVVLLVSGLQLAGVVDVTAIGVLFAGSTPSTRSYAVSEEAQLLRILKHPALIPGDTLELSDSYSVDVEEEFGGFANLPLVNIAGSGSISFQGGVVVMSGGVGDIDMSRVTFNDTELYIDAPNTSLNLGSANDSNINVASLNGAAHTRQLDMPFVGTRMTVPVTFTNISSAALSNFEIELTSPSFIFVDGATVRLDSLGPGATATQDIDVIATEAGRLEITGHGLSNGSLAVTAESGFVNVRGAGYYAGDTHTHTEDSPSIRYGTLETNVENAYDHGMSYIVSVETDLEAQKLAQSEVDGIVGESNAFLQMTGGETEDTEPTSVRQLLIFGTDVRPRSDYGAEIEGFGMWTYQEAVNEVIRNDGLVILPHFFTYGNDLVGSITMAKSVRRATAIEIITGERLAGDTDLKYPVNVWDNYNVVQIGKVFGTFSSNSTYAEDVGTKYIKGYMDSLTEQSFLSMLGSGNYFMSNGPELRFTLGGVEMGGDLLADEEGGNTVMKLYGSDTSPLTKVVVKKFVISGTVDAIDHEIAYEEDFTGQNVYSFYREVHLPIEANTYYRVELTTERARYYNDTGLAMSNPIYVQEGTANSFVYLEGIGTKLGGDVQQAPNGAYYIKTNRVNLNNIRVTVEGAERASVEYHINSGDYVADYITVYFIAKDGTLSYETVYLILD